MSDDVGARVRWLADFCCQLDWEAAVAVACDRVEELDPGGGAPLLQQINDTLFVADRTDRNVVLLASAERARPLDPPLARAWELLALCTDDAATVINAVVAGALGVISSTDGDTREARARLRVWDGVASGKYAGNDFFEIASRFWRGEMQRIVADQADESRVVGGIPTCVEILAHDRWDSAMAWLRRETERQVAPLDLVVPQPQGNREQQAIQIAAVAETLFAQGRPWAGDLAIAWLAMLCNPRQPASFTAVLPQIAWMCEHHAVITNPDERRLLRDRLDVWWRAARGEWTNSDVSIFRIAAMEMQDRDYDREPADGDATVEPDPAAPAITDAPKVIVMSGKLADARGLPTAWQELRDQALPLVVCRDAAMVREQLRDEYPHAWREVGLLTQDLRDGQPVHARPTLLLGDPGSGKSRLVRRLGELIGGGMYVYRYDGAAAHDGTFAGSPKSWSTAQPSAPARAIVISRTANPIVFVDEIEKGGESNYNGNLWHAMAAFLERETAARYREIGLDAQLDLSHVVHIATANSVEKLPAPLRDRFRVIRIPSPSLQHLPALAAQVMSDMTAEDDERMCDAALADDELEIIGRAWERERFSMRKLQRLVAATLEARDACARRH
ncbi:AAA family ATPase [Bradyrhizobium sp. Pear76]|uniref:AAA family ATPase n=1 Tax=Bradyrhizobium oropedii TaxID=1571201 RepID=UPI001E4FFD74|nr:AAA family ATPase [Bradyrhizobium oropedii]MCC8961636.1 AAA family ATPase [Bradyrhizobium oropedii]